jgi:nucleotide-binding universal stress UspA family protein
MKRIVIGTDGSAGATRAVEDGLELAREVGAAVTFVFARATPSPLLGEPYHGREVSAGIAHARDVVREAMLKASLAGVDADYEIVDGSPPEVVLDVAETHDADLIVVGSRGLGAVQSALFGSVSKSLVTRSRRPVLVVKEPSRQQPQRNVALVHHGTVLG